MVPAPRTASNFRSMPMHLTQVAYGGCWKCPQLWQRCSSRTPRLAASQNGFVHSLGTGIGRVTLLQSLISFAPRLLRIDASAMLAADPRGPSVDQEPRMAPMGPKASARFRYFDNTWLRSPGKMTGWPPNWTQATARRGSVRYSGGGADKQAGATRGQ